ncbi:phosphoribosyl-ATP pyrophosphatase [Acetobacter farinalis]|nr:phosphoribosyl-ATP pyrophosphatase [Acetobacter farinalis]
MATAPVTMDRTEAVKQVNRDAGRHAMACTAAFIAGNRADIIRESAAFIRGLEAIWAEEEIDPAEVWTELLRRIEIGELFLRLNQPPHRRKLDGKSARPWRITTSKLP